MPHDHKRELECNEAIGGHWFFDEDDFLLKVSDTDFYLQPTSFSKKLEPRARGLKQFNFSHYREFCSIDMSSIQNLSKE